MERAGHAQIDRERDEVAQQLRDELAQSASTMCARILATTLTEERHRALLDQFIADIKNMADSETVTPHVFRAVVRASETSPVDAVRVTVFPPPTVTRVRLFEQKE